MYSIDDILPAPNPGSEPTPSSQNNFTNAVNPSALSAGSLIGNTTIEDGFLQSSNYVAASTGWKLTPTSGELNFAVSVDTLDIPDTVTANSFHVDIDGDTWWGATTLGASVASVTKAGVGTFSNIVITGGSVTGVPISGIPNTTVTDLSIMEMSHNLSFSVTDADTIAWSSGTIVMSNGRTFAISAGNTGNMAALTYIYLDPAVSSTVLQTTTTYTTAMGNNKRLIGTAQNNTVTASYIPYGPGTPLVDGANIGAFSIVAGNIAATTITAAKMNVSTLSSITANIGAITAGTITLDTSGYVRGGQTDYDTGTGFFLGYSGAAYKFSIGVGASTSNNLTWDGTTLTVNGSAISNQDIYGDGSDGVGTISGNTTLTRDMFYTNCTISSSAILSNASFRIFCTGTLTIGSGCFIRNNGAGGTAGSDASPTGGAGGAGGAAVSSGSLPSGVAGGAGGAGNNAGGSTGTAGVAGADAAKSVGSVGVAGGAGGAGHGSTSSSSGGAGGAAGSQTGTVFNTIKNAMSAYNLIDTQPSVSAFTDSSGTGGGGGGGGATFGGSDGGGGGGGGSGSTGGFIAIFAKKIVNSGTIEAKGGAGAAGGIGASVVQANGGGGGGGSGGSGGVIILIYSSITAGSVLATGGAAGSGGIGGTGSPGTNGDTGSNGNAGNTGVIIQLQV